MAKGEKSNYSTWKYDNHLNLKGKCLITIGAALIIIIGTSLLWTIQQEKKMVQFVLENRAKMNGELIKNSLEVFMANGLQEELSEFLQKTNSVEGVQNIKLIKNNSANSIEQKVLKSGKNISEFDQTEKTYRKIFPFIATEGCQDCHDVKPGEILGAASITLNQDISNKANLNIKTLAGFGLVQVAIILAVLYLIIGTIILKPLEKLTSAAKRFSKDDSNISVKISSKDEIGTLATIFNKMIEKIGLQFDYLDNIPTPITVIDNEFNIQYINKASLQFVSKSKSECLNEKCYNLFKMNQCQSEKCCTKKAFQSGIECSDETVAFPGEMKIPVLYTAAPLINNSGEQIGVLESITDISGYKSLLNEVKAQEEYLAASTSTMLVEMEKFAKGDLRIELISERQDEIGQLFTGFNNSIKNVSKILTNVKEAIISGASAGAQISSSLEEMSAGAQQQNQQALEIAGAVEEMTKTILENAENATKASEASKHAKKRAENGEQVIQQTQEGMGKIISSAQKTGEIISSFAKKTDQIDAITQLIDDIADQTNLLALNAAIEAARAGEHGRGFAVVADEVRALAERTTQATKEISKTIQAIQMDAENANDSKEETDKAIGEGLHLLEEIGESFHDILEESDKVSDIVFHVASATEEQSTSSEQISKNIASISEVTRQTAVGIEQMAMAADGLSQLMEELQSMIQNFKIGENGQHKRIEFGEEDSQTVANSFELVNN